MSLSSPWFTRKLAAWISEFIRNFRLESWRPFWRLPSSTLKRLSNFSSLGNVWESPFYHNFMISHLFASNWASWNVITFASIKKCEKQIASNQIRNFHTKQKRKQIIYSWRASNVNGIRFIVLPISKKLCHKSRRRSYLEFIRIAFRYAQIFFRYEPVSFLFRYVSSFAKASESYTFGHSPYRPFLFLMISFWSFEVLYHFPTTETQTKPPIPHVVLRHVIHDSWILSPEGFPPPKKLELKIGCDPDPPVARQIYVSDNVSKTSLSPSELFSLSFRCYLIVLLGFYSCSTQRSGCFEFCLNANRRTILLSFSISFPIHQRRWR